MKKNLGNIVERCIRVHGLSEAAEVLDYIKATGFKYSTLAGITFSVADVEVPEAKKEKQGLPHPGPHQGHSREAWWGRASPHGQTQDSPAPDAGRQSAPALSGSRGRLSSGLDTTQSWNCTRTGAGWEQRWRNSL